jgi:hypothetical protein
VSEVHCRLMRCGIRAKRIPTARLLAVATLLGLICFPNSVGPAPCRAAIVQPNPPTTPSNRRHWRNPKGRLSPQPHTTIDNRRRLRNLLLIRNGWMGGGPGVSIGTIREAQVIPPRRSELQHF